MFVDAHDLNDGAVVQTRICVVGAGAAGVTVARSLVGRPDVDVCLLEGGGEEPEADSRDLYIGADVGDYRLGVSSCRERYLGGTTNRWAGWCHALEAADFAPHPFIERSGWPIDAQTLAPYYAQARETVEIGVGEPLEAVAQRVGHLPLALAPDRVRTVLYQYSTPPTAFGERYGPELTAADNVTLYVHANVIGITLHDSGTAVQALRCVTFTGVRFEVQAEHFVLAMGGIENPRLLLAEGLGNGSGLLGRCFMEHPHYMGQAYILAQGHVDLGLYTQRWRTPTFDADHPEGIEVEVRGALALPATWREAQGLVSMAATLFEADLDDPPEAMGAAQADTVRGLLRSGGDDLRLYGIDLRSEQRPSLDSSITLGDEVDALGVPRVEARWTIESVDLDDARATLSWIGAELGRASMGRLWMPTDPQGAFSPSRVTGGCHHMGTTRMSASPSEGVVDADCRVHGIDNLYLAGSSVFATGGFANPTLTIVALAHRLAAHLEGTL